jgi:hypothetical protein
MHGLYTLPGAGFVLVWLYEQLAGQLIDNYFDSGGLRDRHSDLVTPGATPRCGISAQLTLTKKKRKSKSVTSRAARKVLYLPCKDQSHFAPLAWMTAMRADRPGFGTRTTTVMHCFGHTLGPSQLAKIQLHCLYLLNGPHCRLFWCNPQLRTNGVSIEDFCREKRHWTTSVFLNFHLIPFRSIYLHSVDMKIV